VLRLCDKIMGEKFRAVFLQYRLLNMASYDNRFELFSF
jgi:hypothetical protein